MIVSLSCPPYPQSKYFSYTQYNIAHTLFLKLNCPIRDTYHVSLQNDVDLIKKLRSVLRNRSDVKYKAEIRKASDDRRMGEMLSLDERLLLFSEPDWTVFRNPVGRSVGPVLWNRFASIIVFYFLKF